MSGKPQWRVISEAIDAYARQLPPDERMLLEAGRGRELERYVAASDAPDLLAWWAAYCESQGRFDEARACYRLAHAHVDLVRLACYSKVGSPA